MWKAYQCKHTHAKCQVRSWRGCFAVTGPGQLAAIEFTMNSSVHQSSLERKCEAVCLAGKAWPRLADAIARWLQARELIHNRMAKKDQGTLRVLHINEGPQTSVNWTNVILKKEWAKILQQQHRWTIKPLKKTLSQVISARGSSVRPFWFGLNLFHKRHKKRNYPEFHRLPGVYLEFP